MMRRLAGYGFQHRLSQHWRHPYVQPRRDTQDHYRAGLLNDLRELNEILLVKLSNPTSATLHDALGIGTIITTISSGPSTSRPPTLVGDRLFAS